MDQLTPIYRIEYFLDAIVNNSANDLDPIYRVEFFLAKIAGRAVETPPPLSRMEMYLAQLCGESVTLPQPLSRTEQYLAAICGEDVEIPPFPVYRIEYWLAAWAEGGSEIVTVTGVSPLALLDAVAHPIHSLTQYGLCVQDGTPTPDAPVDILTNNGALRYGATGRNLYDPSTAVFEVGYYYAPTADGAQTAAQNNFIYHSYIPIEAGAAYVFYGRKQSDNRLSQYNRIHWYAADKTYIGTNTYTAGTIGKGVAPDNAAYARLSCNPQGANTAITEETVLSYNWTFCKGTAEVTPFVPFVGGIYTDGTDEVLTVRTNNLVDVAHLTPVNLAYSGNRLVTSAERYGYYIPVKPNTKYTVSISRDKTGAYLNICETTSEPANNVAVQAYNTMDGATASKTITTKANANYLYVYTAYVPGFYPFDSGDFQIEEGQTATPYAPYHRETASVPMLLGVGNYKDEAELIGGLLTHEVGIKVLDGTENWTAYQTSFGVAVLQNATSAWGAVAGAGGYCTHMTVLQAGETTFAGSCRFATDFNVYDYKTAFGVADVAGFKAKLAALYAAGTPVIVVYPLATETTEQTTPHALHTSAGTNIVSVAAAVEGVTVSVEYAKQSA